LILGGVKAPAKLSKLKHLISELLQTISTFKHAKGCPNVKSFLYRPPRHFFD